uniref:Prokineticin domain-containing protein n=1 Tax=Strigamia maritima TaxID=126957 RepID=T1JH61_STRMM
MLHKFVNSLIFIFIISTAIGVYKEGHTSPLHGLSECSNEGDCGHGRCCVIGMHRYSVPSCASVGHLGDYCIGGGKGQNLTLSFPNGLSIRVVNTYTLFCPCDADQGLVCHRAQCVFRDDVALNNVF